MEEKLIKEATEHALSLMRSEGGNFAAHFIRYIDDKTNDRKYNVLDMVAFGQFVFDVPKHHKDILRENPDIDIEGLLKIFLQNREKFLKKSEAEELDFCRRIYAASPFVTPSYIAFYTKLPISYVRDNWKAITEKL